MWYEERSLVTERVLSKASEKDFPLLSSSFAKHDLLAVLTIPKHNHPFLIHRKIKGYVLGSLCGAGKGKMAAGMF